MHSWCLQVLLWKGLGLKQWSFKRTYPQTHKRSEREWNIVPKPESHGAGTALEICCEIWEKLGDILCLQLSVFSTNAGKDKHAKLQRGQISSTLLHLLQYSHLMTSWCINRLLNRGHKHRQWWDEIMHETFMLQFPHATFFRAAHRCSRFRQTDTTIVHTSGTFPPKRTQTNP